MAFQTADQFQQALAAATSALVLCRPNPSYDEIAASLAISAHIKTLGKESLVVSENYSQPSALKFLSTTDTIKSKVGQLQDFVISIQLPGDGLENIRHEVVDGKAVINITPTSGIISPSDISMRSSKFRFDLIVVVGAPDAASLGATYSENTSLFNAIPVITVDCSPANEHFGHINIVDITLTSVSEVVYSLLAECKSEILHSTANLLLTGMIAATQSFKTRNVNARTLQTASALISLGADREQIVHNLYRQRSVAALKLWGAVLSRVQTDVQQPLMWSTLTREDFARAGAKESDLNDLIDELIYTAPNTKVFSLIYESPDKPEEIIVIVDAQRPYRADILSGGFTTTHGTTSRTQSVLERYTLADASTRVTNVLRAKMRE